METETIAPVGHNRPPISPPAKEDLKEQLEREHAALFADHAALVAACDKVPEVIADDETQGKVAEVIKKARLNLSDLEARRALEKRPWSDLAATVDAVFNNRRDVLKKGRDRINERAEAYTKRKAAEESARLEDEARKRREAAEAALREAEAAEARRKEAEWDRMVADAERDNALWDRDNADRLKREAEERLAAAKAREAAEAAARLKRQQEDEAIEAKRRDEAAWDRMVAEAELANATFDRDRAIAAQRAAEAETRQHAATIRQEASVERSQMATASREERRAERFEDRSEARGLGAVRSEHGAIQTTQRRWVARVIDYDQLSARDLWPYVSQEARSAALYAFMRAGGRVTPGAIIEEVEEGRNI